MIKPFLKAVTPAPVRRIVRLSLRTMRDLYDRRRVIAFPYARQIRAQVYGKPFVIPVRFSNYNSPAKRPQGLTWKSVFFELLHQDHRRIFLDIGTNVGQTLMEFKASGAPQKYIGFEASPICAGYCNELIIANKIDATVYCCGLSNVQGQTKLLVNPQIADDSGASIISDLRPEKEEMGIPVVLQPLDNFLNPKDISSVALVKIDVEGAEHLVLEGAEKLLAQGDPVIVCEVLRSARKEILERQQGLLSLVEKHGYEVFRIGKTVEDYGELKLSKVVEFPAERWRMNTASQNDYLIVRRANLERLVKSSMITIQET